MAYPSEKVWVFPNFTAKERRARIIVPPPPWPEISALIALLPFGLVLGHCKGLSCLATTFQLGIAADSAFSVNPGGSHDSEIHSTSNLWASAIRSSRSLLLTEKMFLQLIPPIFILLKFIVTLSLSLAAL